MGRGNQTKAKSSLSALFTRRQRGSKIESYYAYGLRPDEARAYRKQGVAPRVAGELAAHGIGPGEAQAALSSGIPYAELGRWLAASFSVADAGRWRAAGFTLEEAREWRRVVDGRLEKLRGDFAALLPGDSAIEGLAFWKEHGIRNPRALARALYGASGRPLSTMRLSSPADFLRAWKLGRSIESAFRLGEREGAATLYGELLAAGYRPDDAELMARKGIAVEAAARWRERFPELSPSDVGYLHCAGLTPDGYAPWRERVPLYPVDAAIAFAAAGITDPGDGGEWLELAQSPRFEEFFQTTCLGDAIKAGLEPEHIRKLIEDYGIPASRLLDYLEGGGDLDTYFAWQEHPETRDLDPVSYKDLERIGVTPRTAELVPEYNGVMVSPFSRVLTDEVIEDLEVLCSRRADPKVVRELHRLASRGLQNTIDDFGYRPVAELYAAMEECDLSLDELRAWLDALNHGERLSDTAREIRAWHRHGFDLESAREWVPLSVLGTLDRDELPPLASKARRQGLSASEAWNWRIAASFDDSEADAWIEFGIKDVATASGLRSLGESPEHHPRMDPYLEAGVPIAEVYSWLRADIDVEEAAKWRAAGIRDGAAARQWIEAGVSPEQASSYEERRRAAGP